MTDKDLQGIAFDVLREMYQEAEPPMDFDHALENPDEYGEDWYQEHYLPVDKQNQILKRHCEKHDLSQSERAGIQMECILNRGPTNVPPEENDDN